jgi:hypothetical protein
MYKIEKREHTRINKSQTDWRELFATLRKIKLCSDESFFIPLKGGEHPSTLRTRIYSALQRDVMDITTRTEKHPKKGIGLRIWRDKDKPKRK